MFDIDIRPEQFASVINIEHNLLEYSSINGPSYIPATGAINLDITVKADRFIRIIQPSHIILLNNQDIVIKTEGFIKASIVESCLSHLGSISWISYIFMTSAASVDIIVTAERFIRTTQSSPVYLLNNLDIDIKVERFIKTFHSSYIHLIKDIYRQAPSGDHQQILKSHLEASSMSTSEEHIIHMQDIMVTQTGLDIQTFCIYMTISNVLFSKYLITNESIIDNHFHTVISVVHQWEALDITHLCPSRSRASKSHHIEWEDIVANIIHSNFFSYCFIKNIHIHSMTISSQEFSDIIYYIYIKAVQDQLTIIDIKEVQQSHSIIQNISYNYVNHNISKKKDSIRADTIIGNILNFITFTILIVNTINTISDNIFEYINYTHLVLLNNINVNQQFDTILQNDNYILDNTTQTDIYNYYILFSDFIDISNKYFNTSYIVDYLINNTITTESVTSIQLQRLIHNQYTFFFNLQQLNIIYHTSSISSIHHRIDIHFQYLINLFEKYITLHLIINFVFNIASSIIYLNQFIMEPYSTISETIAIRNAETFVTSYVDIKVYERYNTLNNTDILVYAVINIVKLMASSQKTGIIIYVKTILSFYVFIIAPEVDILIMKIEETSKHILVDILISRIEGDVVTNFWPSHREGV